MTSGIYLIYFDNTAKYIGKSNNIERRWEEHTTKFNKGTAAKSMQDAYDRYGLPEFQIVHKCHEDHIDLMESIYIRNNWSEELLNTTRPTEVSEEDEAILLANEALLKVSTANHIRLIELGENALDKSMGLIENLENYIELMVERDPVIKSLTENVEELTYEVELKKQEIDRLNSRGFFSRLFNT